MVAAIPRNSGKSAWHNDKCRQCRTVSGPDSAVCDQCKSPLLRPLVKSRNGRYRLVTGFRSSTYRRMKPDRPASTITTASGHIGSNYTIHPFENRVLSILECALLQTLPKTFRWGNALEKWGHTPVREMIGEAVPPLFTVKHGRIIYSLLNQNYRCRSIKSEHKMCTSAVKKLRTVTF